MYGTIETRRAHAEGRAEQYLEMMQAFSALESKYGGVRGALLKKVREELEKHAVAGQPRGAGSTLETRRAQAEGRAEQYLEMMQTFSALESKYGGVRGALLKKVREELDKLKPLAAEGRASSPASAPAQPVALRRCDACGRDLKPGPNGKLVCMNGHVRAA